METCKNCNTEYNEIVSIENENVCPYCYIKINIELNNYSTHENLMDVILSNNIVKQVIEGLDNKDYSIYFLILTWIISMISVIILGLFKIF